jgi:site-specific recombinase XerD
MKKQSFSIVFFVRKTRLNKKGETPVMARITYHNVRAEFQTKRDVSPSKWNVAKEKVNGSDASAGETNRYLDEVRVKLLSIHRELECEGKEITAHIIKGAYLGTSSTDGENERTILALFKDHNYKMKELVGREFSQKTADRYNTTYRHITEFMKKEYRRPDMMINEVDYNFVSRYDHWLKIVKKCKHNSSIKHLKALKKVVFIARRNGWLKHNPFENFKLKEEPVDKQFLSENELKAIMDKEISNERINKVRDIFLFCCYTGLSYIDAMTLRPEDIEVTPSGGKYIHTERMKTRNDMRIPLLPAALRIMNKYADHPKCVDEGTVLPKMSNQRLNSYLEEIGNLCDINKKITMHVARHTFATSVTLKNGVPLETVSKLLGHSDIKTTMIYARMTDDKIHRDMDVLTETLRNNPHLAAIV